MSPVTLLILLMLIIAMAIYLWGYRAEGLMALYILGLPLVFAIVQVLSVPWSTVMTGLVRPAIFVPCVIWWMLSERDRDEAYLPRQFRWGAAAIVLLFLFWEAKCFFESQYVSVRIRSEYFKWAYILERWGGAFVLGLLMPLSLKRLRRFLGAMGMLGIAIGTITVLGYLMGARSMEGGHFSVIERGSGLGVGIAAGSGGACLLGYMLLTNEIRKSQARVILLSGAAGLLAITTLVTASRGPMTSMFLAAVALLLLLRGRNSFRIALGLLVLGIVVAVGLSFLDETTKHQLFGTYIGRYGKGGVFERWKLFVDSFNILSVAPFFGRTIGLERILGIEVSHQIWTEVMVELGLVGLTVFMLAFIPTAVRWGRAGWRTGTDVRIFAAPLCVWSAFELVQSTIAGSLASVSFWVLLGLAMGHRLRAQVIPSGQAEDLLGTDQLGAYSGQIGGPYTPEDGP